MMLPFFIELKLKQEFFIFIFFQALPIATLRFI
jgi:hypothetical protein